MKKRKVSVYVPGDLWHDVCVAASRMQVPISLLVETILRTSIGTGGGSLSTVVTGALPSPVSNALDVADVLRDKGMKLERIASQLNERGFRTYNGKRWNSVSVSRVLSLRHSDQGMLKLRKLASYLTPTEIASELNSEGHRTIFGKRWSARTVDRLLRSFGM